MPADLPPPRVPFVVGVYGDTDLGPAESEVRKAVGATVRRIFEHLSRPAHDETPELGPGLGLGNCDIRLLTSLAPGADALVADVAEEVLCCRLEVVVPLPFPVDVGPNTPIPPWWGSMSSGSAAEWDAYQARLQDATPFVVRLADDDDEGTKLQADLGNPARWGARFRAAAEYVSAYSGLLIVVSRNGVTAVAWDEPWTMTGPAGSVTLPPPAWVPVHDPGGTGPTGRPLPEEVLLCKLRGTTLSLMSRDAAFTWADAGLALHVATDGEAAVTPLRPVDTRPAVPPPRAARGHHVPRPLPDVLCPDAAAEPGKTWTKDRAQAFATDASNLGRFQEQAEGYRHWRIPRWQARFGAWVARHVDASLAKQRPAPRSRREWAGRVCQGALRCLVGRPFKWVSKSKYRGYWKKGVWPRIGEDVDLLGHLFGHRSPPVEVEKEPGEAAAMLGVGKHDAPLYPDLAGTKAAIRALTDPKQESPLVALGAARRRAGNLSNNLLSGEWTRLLGRLFLLAFTAAVLLHAAAHWHVPPTAGEPAEEAAHHVQQLLGWAALAPVAVSLALLGWYWWSRHEQFRFDFRALAEGLRVQAYWAAAGLDRSVSANYLQRQREGLGWIRRAVSAMAAPYSEWRRRWNALGGGAEPGRLKIQVGLLTAIHHKWVKAQSAYGCEKSADLHALREAWHPVGYGLALAGVLQAGAWLFWHHGDLDPLPRWCGWVGTGLWLGFIGLLVWGVCTVRDRAPHDDYGAHDPYAAPEPVRWNRRTGTWQRPAARALIGCRWAYQFLHHLCGRYLPKFERRRFWVGVGRPLLAYLASAVVLSLPVYALCVAGGQARPWVPEARTLWEITFGTNLIAGAMAVAWVEKRLVTEEYHQYVAMTRTYLSADRRMSGHLAAARRALKAADAKLVAGAAATAELGEARRRVKAVQELLFQVGLQALDESAEWLLLHRARPIEPVMAG